MQLSLTTLPSAKSVVDPALDFDKHAKALRDLVIKGTNIQAQGAGHMREYNDSLKIVRTAMRADMGMSENT